MNEFNPSRHLVAVQLILLTFRIISEEVEGSVWKNVSKFSGSVARGLIKVPSKVMDGGQIVTQNVAGTVGRAVSPIKPLKTAVDATGGAVSNVLGSTSRLFGKKVQQPHEVLFLYGRSIAEHGKSKEYRDAVKMVIGHALANVVLYHDDMAEDLPMEFMVMPVMYRVKQKLRSSGAAEEDLDDIVKLMSRNGFRDMPNELEDKVLGVLKDTDGNFKNDGPIEEIRWIARHPDGFYRLNDNEMTDYKLKTNSLLSKCTAIQPPFFENTQ